MNHKYRRVSTEDFWRLMCRGGFIRTGYYSGVSRGSRYWCDYPPETAPGFVDRVVYGIKRNLTFRPTAWWHRLIPPFEVTVLVVFGVYVVVVVSVAEWVIGWF